MQAMASVVHYDLRNRNLAEAQVIAWRALDGCIEAAAWGIGKPILICSVTPNGVQLLNPDELKSVEDSVNAWKAAELEALGALGLGGVAAGEDEPAKDEGLEP